MANKILWDKYEAAILLDALVSSYEGRISRKEAIESVSSELRNRAKKKGLEVDDIFRNINGITLRMLEMESILTDGKKGMKTHYPSKLFQNVVALYRNDSAAYEKLLREARNMPGSNHRQDRYFAWLASQVSPAQLSELYIVYTDIEEFCLKRNIIPQKLFALTNLTDIRKVVDTVESNKVFRFTYRKRLSKMSSAMRFYYRFMKEHPELLVQEEFVKTTEKPAKSNKQPEIVPKKPVKRASEPVKQVVPVEVSPVEVSVEESDAVKIDFANIQSLAYTQPTEFSYFGEVQAKVKSWTQLYVSVTQCLLDDYPSVLLKYLNRNIGGQGRCDFTDKIGADNMVAPKKVQDDFYLETNLSATDIVHKIGKLLDLCNVDYENVEVYYRKCGNIAPCTNSMPQEERRIGFSDIDRNREQFVNWMQQSGLAIGTINGYISAIGQSGKAANEYGVWDTDLLLIEDPNILQQILDRLLSIPEFRELNTRQHNRFKAAVGKLIVYRSENHPTMSYAQSATKSTEPVTNRQSISEETRTRYTEILAENFGEDGYQPGRAIFRGRFKRFYAEKFGCTPDESDERIDDIMSIVGTKRDGRIFPKQDDSQNDLVTEIVSDILSAFDAGVSAVYIEAVFDKYRQALADRLQIYNQDALAAMLLAQSNGRYTKKHSYLTNGLAGADSREDLIHIMKSFHRPQNYDAIHEKAWFLSYDKMKTLLVTTASIVNVATETYFYAPNLPVGTEELEHLSSVMKTELSYRSHITDVRLMQLIKEKCPSIAINTDGYSTYGLRNCLGYILRNRFSFNGPIITLKGKELSMADVYAEFAKDHEVLQVDELSDLSREMNITIYWDSVLNEMIRVSATELVRKDLIEFDVDAIDEILEGMCPGDYIPLQDVNLFLHFPNIGYPWNSYLLESYLYSHSAKFCLLHASFSKTGVYGAMVRKDTAIQDYRSLLVDVVSKSDVPCSAKEALQFIVDKGYQLKRRYEGIETVIREAKFIKEKRENQKK